MELKIIDSIMGSGKSTTAINLINSNRSRRWIYVTPYLTETSRICEACSLQQPSDDQTKTTGLKILLRKKKSAVITHALFRLFDDEIRSLIASGEYSIIIDETLDVISPLGLSSYDTEDVSANYLTGEPLRWRADRSDYTGRFEDVKRAADSGLLHGTGSGDLMVMLPIENFTIFNEVYILTYLFDSSVMRYYFDLNGIEREHLVEQSPTDYAGLINIVDDRKMVDAYSDRFALSMSWYRRASAEDLEELRRRTINYFRNKPTVWNGRGYVKARATDTLWTTFKDFRLAISDKGYSKGFVVNNAKATNEYSDRRAVAYLINRFMNPNLKNFFINNGITIDEDAFALSEMLQFIWRSAIRNGEPISLYIPSARMRELLKNWMKI